VRDPPAGDGRRASGGGGGADRRYRGAREGGTGMNRPHEVSPSPGAVPGAGVPLAGGPVAGQAPGPGAASAAASPFADVGPVRLEVSDLEIPLADAPAGRGGAGAVRGRSRD